MNVSQIAFALFVVLSGMSMAPRMCAQVSVPIAGSSSGLPLSVTALPDLTICPAGTAAVNGIATGGNNAAYTYEWLTVGTGTPKSVSPAATTAYTLKVTDAQNCQATDAVTVNVANFLNAPLPLTPGVWHATTECPDGTWTHYYAPTGEMLLSIQKNGLTLGTVGVTPGFDVVAGVTPAYLTGPATEITAPAAPYAAGLPGWFVMNRWWSVENPLNQPPSGSVVPIRTYFTATDVAQVAGSTGVAGIQDMLFYKINNDGVSPNPATGHAGAQVADVGLYFYETGTAPTSSNTFTQMTYGSHFYAEMAVPHFSGGGGGGMPMGSSFPIEWLALTAHTVPQTNAAFAVALDWGTATEVNVSAFEVERSVDGQFFTQIGTTPAHGNSALPQYYQYLDTSAALQSDTWLYYRIKSVDADGETSYSNIEKIYFVHTIGVQVYPNPTRDLLYVAVSGVSHLKRIELLDMAGKVIQTAPLSDIALQSVDVSGLAAGVYTFRIFSFSDQFSGRIIKAE